MTSGLRKKLENGEFVITAELCPPKGADTGVFMEKARLLKKYVNIVNITDNQRAIMRMTSLAGSLLAKEAGLEPVYQLTCRDRNRIALQSDLLGAAGLRICNLLALSGDYVTEGDHPQAKPVFDLDSTLLIRTAAGLNNGVDMAGKLLKGKTSFYIGAAVNPGAEPAPPHRLSFEKKIAAGARFFQTQAIFDFDKFSAFMNYANNFPVKILGGILLMKSVRMAEFLNDRVPGVSIPQQLMARLKQARDPLQTGIEIAREQVKRLRDICDGAHIMTVGREELIPEILAG